MSAVDGVEVQAEVTWELAAEAGLPRAVVINKMDRESRDPFDLLDEIEKTLALDSAPITWPIGRGRDFVGTMEVETGKVRLLDGDIGLPGKLEMTIPEVAALNPNLDATTIEGEFDLVREACKRFDMASFREGHLTPVFFGSALKNFGVSDLLDALGAHVVAFTTSPSKRDTILALGADERIAHVFPFENRGQAIGVTLDHPHGQLYAYPTIPPIPGIVVNRRASSFSFAQRTTSASKAAIRRSSSAHCARASSTSRIMRGLKLAPPCLSISTFRNSLSFHLPCGATNPLSSRMARS